MLWFHWSLRTAWPQGFLCSANSRQKLGLVMLLKWRVAPNCRVPHLWNWLTRTTLIFLDFLVEIENHIFVVIQWGTKRQPKGNRTLGPWVSTTHTSGNKIAHKRPNRPRWGSILLGLLGLPKLSRNSTRLGSQKFAGIHLQQGFSGDLKWTEVKGYLLTSGTFRWNPLFYIYIYISIQTHSHIHTHMYLFIYIYILYIYI